MGLTRSGAGYGNDAGKPATKKKPIAPAPPAPTKAKPAPTKKKTIRKKKAKGKKITTPKVTKEVIEKTPEPEKRYWQPNELSRKIELTDAEILRTWVKYSEDFQAAEYPGAWDHFTKFRTFPHPERYSVDQIPVTYYNWLKYLPPKRFWQRTHQGPREHLTDAVVLREWKARYKEYEEFLRLTKPELFAKNSELRYRKDLPIEEIPDEFITWLENK